MAEPIRSERVVHADPGLVHELLVDIGAWRLWSPHVRWTEPAEGPVAAGSLVSVKAWFSPWATDMLVTDAEAGRGMAWESSGLLHQLRYEQRIEPLPEGSRVSFSAVVEGPLGGPLTALARPLSALGQRRRLARLAALAELSARRESASATS